MRRTSLLHAAAILFLAAAPLGDAFGQGVKDLPLHTERWSDRVLFAWVGDYFQTIRVVALSTERGVVVIDASLFRSADERIRRAIEAELGRKDIAYLINTHFHHDHTAGNQVYADATIVAHRTAPEGMKKELTGEGLADLLEMFKKDSAGMGDGMRNTAPDSREHRTMSEGAILFGAAIAELGKGFIPTYATVLFDDTMTLDMGDMKLELYSVGGTHTPSDIAIFVPEEGLVALGDMTPEQMLPYLRKGAPWDLDAILKNWGRIVASGREIKRVNLAHSDMRLSVETYREQYRYLETLWNGLREMKAKGLTLADAKGAYTIERDFPHFKNKILAGRGINIHENNIEAIWEKIGGK